jgi:hypothetical protein
MKIKSLTKENTTFEKFKKYFDDIQNFKNINKNLSQILRDTEFKRNIINKIR